MFTKQPTESHVAGRRQLIYFGLYNTLSFLSLTNAVWVIYLVQRGQSPFAIGIYETIFHIAKFIAEVPTGAFADLAGRRRSLIIANLLNALSLLLFLVPTPPLIALNFAISGVAYAFRGGAGEALLWSITADPQSAEAHTQRYGAIYSALFVISTIGESVGVATGGFLSKIFLLLPFLAQIVVILLGTWSLLGVPETAPEHATQPTRWWSGDPWRHIWLGMRVAWADPILLALLAISAIAESYWQTIFYYAQLGFHALGFDIPTIGVIIAAALAISAASTATAPLLIRHWRTQAILIGCLASEMVGIAMLSSTHPLASIIGYLIPLQVAVAVLNPVISTALNARVPEAQRATILSFQSGLFSLAMIVFFPGFGLAATLASYAVVYRIALLVFALTMAGIAIFVRIRKRAVKRQ